ncbi:von Willebrand factor D and EGF domain-containing protein-like [Mytilus galloprovincialis]|uniref:von Willebrand factor D and EGF domain-containing protein-like n=1 Tax=Mytilus galloprovincialis TaxID=29158 RepID=UPI003F7C70A5
MKRFKGTCKKSLIVLLFSLVCVLITTPIASAAPCPFPSQNVCKNARILDEPHRSTKFTASNTSRLLCDSGMPDGWYRFKSNGIDVAMPTTCIETDHCGTITPIWFKGILPSTQQGAVEGKGCINRGKEDYLLFAYGGTKCCHEELQICAKNCNGFYVYRLTRSPGCSISYCAGNQTACAYGKIGQNCAFDLYPKMTSQPVLETPKCENGNLQFRCLIPFDSQDNKANFNVTWMVDGKPIIDFRTHQPIIQTLTNGQRIATLNAYKLARNMGKRLQCSVRSYYLPMNVNSGALASHGIFTGISAEPPSITTSENGTPQEITLKTSIPHCAPMGSKPSCDFAVEIKGRDNFTNDFSTAGCSYPFIYNPINHKCEAKIKIVATRDFVKDGDKTHTLSFQPIETAQNKHPSLQNIMWMKHQISPVQVHTIDKKKGICRAVTDPHITSIAGKSVQSYNIGVSELYRTKASCTSIRPLKIHIQSNKACYAHRKGACICGIVAQEGNDIVEVNGCTQRKNVYYVSKYKRLVDGTTFHTDTGGKKFYINFPSGARLTVTSNDKYQMFSPVTLDIPSDHKGCAEGQCGSFDGKYIDRNGNNWANSTSALNNGIFSKSWFIPSPQSLFDKKPSSINPKYRIDQHEFCQCVQNTTSCTGSANNPLKHVFNGKKGIPITNKKNPRRRRSEPAKITNYLRKRSLPTWPTATGKTLSYATELCKNSFQKASLYPYCKVNVDGYSAMIESCTEDIRITDSLNFLDNYVSVYNEACQITIAGDTKYYVVGTNGHLVLPDYVTSHVCPNECSMRGRCHQGQCLCNSGYHGPDCAVKVGSVPFIHFIYGDDNVDGLCDIRQENCLTSFIVADNIMFSSSLLCRVQYLTMENTTLVDDKIKGHFMVEGIFTSFNELECSLPLSDVSKGALVGGFRISITTDGLHYSNEDTLIIYDSLCQECNAGGDCKLKPNTCEIDGQCRQKGEQNSEHQICEPSVNQLKWTTDQRVNEIDHFTATLTGCMCVDDPGSFTCACCQNAGCPCASLSPHQCVDCRHQDKCGKYPEIFNI